MPAAPPSRSIVHLDADAFFASVEQAADASLRGKAIAVGGEKRGIIASASYEARKMGIYTPMPTTRARKLCPKLIIVPGDFEKYERFSQWMFSYAYDFTPDVEISSIDEGYFDLTGVRKSAYDIAAKISKAIRDSLKITVSEGIARNKLVSQIAAKLYKPAALQPIPCGEEKSFLAPLESSWLPGIGPKTATRLGAAGLALIGQVAQTPLELLGMLIGKTAADVKHYANGVDERPVVPASAPAKSYSHQQTFNKDTTDETFAEATLHQMADDLMRQARAEGKSIRTVTVKVRYNDMAEEQRSASLPEPTDLESDVYGRISALLKEAWSRRVSLRLVSLKFSNVYDVFFREELPLQESAQLHAARRRLSEAVDGLFEARGKKVIFRGHDFLLRETPAEYEADGAGAKPRIQIRMAPPRKQIASVPLRARSYYSFLDSGLSPERIVQLAAENNCPAAAMIDRGNLHGAVAFAQAAQAAGIKALIGAEILFNGKPLALIAENETGYRNLCRLLTQFNGISENGDDAEGGQIAAMQRGETSNPLLSLLQLDEAKTKGLIALSCDPSLARFFPGSFYLGISHPDELRRFAGLQHPKAAFLPIHYGARQERVHYDILQSIRTLTLLRQEHPRKQLAGEFHFPNSKEMNERFKTAPELLHCSIEIAERCRFALPFGKPGFPAFQPPDGSNAAEFLCRLVFEGLKRRYRERSPRHRQQVEEELGIINEVGYAEYFLSVWSILQDCRKEGIDWITRGSAADSLVCYCLGISGVCPIRFELYFRRFLNKDRMLLDKLPDIDIDFPHDRKDDVIDLIFRKYPRGQVAVVGGFSTYQARAAIADIAKVLGVTEYQIRRFTEKIPFGHARDLEKILDSKMECRDLPFREEPYKTAVQMADFMDGFPRHPKMHPCGVVVGRGQINDLTPCFHSNKGYPTTHFDMESVEAVGLIKMDILAQGGLAVMRDVRSLVLNGCYPFDKNSQARLNSSPEQPKEA
jgi:nucleotidyltransferase/DNA polymerase involved in DNA repair